MSIFEMLLFLVLVVVAIGAGWALGRWQTVSYTHLTLPTTPYV